MNIDPMMVIGFGASLLGSAVTYGALRFQVSNQERRIEGCEKEIKELAKMSTDVAVRLKGIEDGIAHLDEKIVDLRKSLEKEKR